MSKRKFQSNILSFNITVRKTLILSSISYEVSLSIVILFILFIRETAAMSMPAIF